MNKLKLDIKGKTVEKEYESGTTFEQVANEFQSEYEDKIAVVIANGKIRELSKTIEKDATISFQTYRDDIGHSTYVRTAIMMLMKAIDDVVGKENIRKIKVEFAIGAGFYCSKIGDFKITDNLIAKINARMNEIAKERIPITKKSYSMDDAMDIFHKSGMQDKEKLFRYRRSSRINIYCMDGYYDYYYGYMLPDTGYVTCFQVIAYDEGMMLILPKKNNPDSIDFFEPREKLFQTLKQSTKWSKEVGIETVGDLNDQICKGNLNDLILVQEAAQERNIGEIGKQIVEKSDVKFVMIAGPSSSGKTSFANRLSIQLRTLGKVPHLISLDDYFVNREDTPRDENGDYNFECLEAIDVKQFNADMLDLLDGKTIDMPCFNFKTGQREYHGNKMTLHDEDILVIEGIHGLNDKMSYSLPAESKFKVYISALTSLNVDEHNRISTTDGRLLRRMVRDARTRGASAKRTIEMWPSVRRGEEENIFPFQESADAMFNSVLIYELAVIKQYAEPLLFNIQPGEPEYFEAKRLLKFLGYFLGVSSDSLPNNSICREFVGGSCFRV